MTFCRNYCRFERCLLCSRSIAEQFITATASPVFRVSTFRAGCLFPGGPGHSMTFRRDHCRFERCLLCTRSIAEQFFTPAARPVFGIAGFRASCLFPSGPGHLMTFCRNYDSSGRITYSADYAVMGFGSVFCTCSFFVCSKGLIPLVTDGTNCIILFIAANCAYSLTTSVFCAGCRVCNYPRAVYMLTCTTRISGFTRIAGCTRITGRISSRIPGCTCPGQQNACARILRKACVKKPIRTCVICKQFHIRGQIDGSLDHRDCTVKNTACVCKRCKLPATEVQFKHILAAIEHIGNGRHFFCIES